MDFSNFWWQGVAGDDGGGGDAGDPIGQSLRFRGTQSLSGHSGGSGTASVWIKRGKLTTAQTVMTGIAFDAAGKLNASVVLFRDPSAWLHVVVNADGTYVNGERVANGSAIAANTIGTSCVLYLAEFHFVDGQKLDPTTFGRFNANGVWVPVDPQKDGDTAWYGTNGFHLTFADPGNVGKDYSGNGNDFTANGFDTASSAPTYDIMQDSPTNNFATINPLYPGASTSNANLTTANATGKPTIIGLAGNVHVAGASTAWDGTEAGWAFTGDVDFGQRLTPDEISTANMPAPTIANGRDHFQAITAAGADILTEAQSAFPDGFWWIKDRKNSNQHQLVDSVNGITAVFNSPIGTSNNTYTAPTGDSIAWCWNAADTNGGFSITNGTHGLGVVPAMVMDRAGNIWHQSLPAGQGLKITTNAGSTAQAWTVDATTVTGPGGGTYYAWSEIPGYSAFGFYKGNSSNDGPFVSLLFRPAFVMFKTNTATNWAIHDSARAPYNPCVHDIQPNTILGDSSATMNVDFVSNGFKVRTASATINSANIYYAAFAENPFQSPVTAR